MSIAEAGDRTVLAWRRSGLSLVACGLAMARGIGGVDAPSRPVAGAVVVGLGLAVWVLFVLIARRRSTAGVGEEPRPAGVGEIVPIALGTALIGAVCVGIGWFA